MGNLSDEISFAARNRVAFKDAHTSLYSAIGFTHFLTLAWNCDAHLRVAKSDLRALHARVDEELLGRRYYRVPQDKRTLAMFVFEGVGHNLHVHSLWRVPKGPVGANRALRFHRMFPDERGGLWNEVVPSGSYKLTVMNSAADASRYILKEQHMNSSDETVVWSSDFARTN